MKNNNILIVEDEQIIAENLRYILNEYGYQQVEIAIDAEQARQKHLQKNYALILMDINLGENKTSDGIDLITDLNKEYNFKHIYITANADNKTVQKAKETEPSGFIVKPFTKKAIFANVEIALSSFSKNESFEYYRNGIKKQIYLHDITHIKSDGSYIHIFTKDNTTHFTRKSLIDFESTYENFFIRIHRSTLINKEHIKGYNSQFVKVVEHKLTIGRSYKEHFSQRIKELS